MAERTLYSAGEAAFRTVDDADLPTSVVALMQHAQAALASNISYLALASPSNAQNVAQVQALTRQCNALIRLLTNQLDTTAGT